MAINVRVSSCSTIFFFRALPKRLYDFKTLWLVYWLVGALWRDTKTVIGLTIVQDAVLVHFVLEQRTQQRTLYTAKNTYQHNVLLSTRSISTLGSVPWHLVKTEGFFSFFSAINGNYSEWSDWSECSRSCSGGIKTRKRECINPSPRYNGRDCKEIGSAIEKVHCNPQSCPGIIIFLRKYAFLYASLPTKWVFQ